MEAKNKLNKWFETKEPSISEKSKNLQNQFDNAFGDMMKEFKIKSFKEERING